MKLRLNYEQGVAILDVLEGVDPRSAEALKAGLSSILKDGRKRIVIDLSQAHGVEMAFATELIKLGALAGTLNGQLALVGQGAPIRNALRAAPLSAGSLPKLFSSKTAALSFLTQPQAAATDLEQLKRKASELAAENGKLKARAAELGQLGELRALRKANGRLSLELARMSEQLAALAKEKSPTHSSLLLDRKVEALERFLVHLLGNDGLLGRTGAKP